VISKRVWRHVLNLLAYLAVIVVIGLFLLIFGDVFLKGIVGFDGAFLKRVFPMVMNTLLLVALSMAISVPLALATVLYLREYAKMKWFVQMVRFCADALAGVPSIIFGLVGMSFFVRRFGFGFSLYSGAFTIAILILPTLLRTFEEALVSVSSGYKMAALSLGASKFRALTTVVIPAAKTPILSGIMLALGRVVGETAALVLTMGTAQGLVRSGWDSGRTLSVHMFLIAKESVTMTEAYASALLLLGIVWLINILANKMAGDAHG
jgi:phosphate transport system permease protein